METAFRDFRELLELFNEHDVAYVIAGAHALAFHGHPRYTGDLDILVHATAENAGRVFTALQAFGFDSTELVAEDFQRPGNVVQLGVSPVRVDLLTSLTGVTWEAAREGSEPGDFDGVPVRYLGRSELIANKRALGRPQDLADLDALGQ